MTRMCAKRGEATMWNNATASCGRATFAFVFTLVARRRGCTSVSAASASSCAVCSAWSIAFASDTFNRASQTTSVMLSIVGAGDAAVLAAVAAVSCLRFSPSTASQDQCRLPPRPRDWNSSYVRGKHTAFQLGSHQFPVSWHTAAFRVSQFSDSTPKELRPRVVPSFPRNSGKARMSLLDESLPDIAVETNADLARRVVSSITVAS